MQGFEESTKRTEQHLTTQSQKQMMIVRSNGAYMAQPQRTSNHSAAKKDLMKPDEYAARLQMAQAVS